jgi:hypothetical protein
MGTRFELIADSALEYLDDYYKKCQVCGAQAVPLFECQGSVISDVGTSDPPKDVYAVCEACVKQGRVARTCEFQTDAVIEKFATDPKAAKELLRRTPPIPVMLQHQDWPICCGQLTEFMGVPDSYEESISIPDDYQFWEAGFRDWKEDWGDDFTLEPESLDEVSKFRCRSCGRKIFTWQCT